MQHLDDVVTSRGQEPVAIPVEGEAGEGSLVGVQRVQGGGSFARVPELDQRVLAAAGHQALGEARQEASVAVLHWVVSCYHAIFRTDADEMTQEHLKQAHSRPMYSVFRDH